MSNENTETEVKEVTDMNVTMANRNKLFDKIKRGWLTLNTYIICGLICALIGVGVGIKAAQKFYSDKMDDCVLVQGLVFKGKPYTILPK